MKWQEPWTNMLRRQGPFNPFTKREVKGGLIWAGMLLFLGMFSAFAKDGTMGHVEMAPFVFLLGFGISLFVSFAHWASPLTVSSGPNGIVKSKGGTHALIPWATVREHRSLDRDGVLVLELVVSYQSEPEILYLPVQVSTKETSDEIKPMTGVFD
jgi:hypothetical protein